MTDPSRPPPSQQHSQPGQGRTHPQGILPPGTIIPSTRYPGGRSIVIEERPNFGSAQVVEERVTRDWEYVTVARPVDLHEKVVEVPTTRTVQTLVPKIQVREVVKTIPKEEIEYEKKIVEIPHQKIVDKYVEVPIVSGTEIKYVPKVEVRERTVKMTKPEIKWVEKVIEVPQIKEVVRYIESDKNVETVIRYVPKRKDGAPAEIPDVSMMQHTPAYAELKHPPVEMAPRISGAPPGVHTPRAFVPLAQTEGRRPQTSLPPSPRLEKIEQLFVPRVAKTVEVEKQIPVTVDIPVPFMVPKPVQVPVEVPVLRFRDHFIPVPIRRHVIPRIIFTDEVYEVDCVKEKPVLVVEDYFKPVPVDVKIKLKEKDIKVIPVDPAELSQADFHAMWMRVNADLLENWREAGGEALTDARVGSGAVATTEQLDEEEEEKEDEDAIPDIDEPGLSEEKKEERLRQRHEARQQRRRERAERRRLEAAERGQAAAQQREASLESIRDPTGPPDFGPLPLHPGHPLMMTHLQSQWIQNPSTITHNMYTPELFRLHASALDSVLHPQPHQVNITQEQSVQLGPLPAEQLPNPWQSLEMDEQLAAQHGRYRGRKTDVRSKTQDAYQDGSDSFMISTDAYGRPATGCSPCSNICCPP